MIWKVTYSVPSGEEYYICYPYLDNNGNVTDPHQLWHDEFKAGDIVVFFECTSTRAGRLIEAQVVGSCKRGGYDCVEMKVLSGRQYDIGNIEVRAEHNVAKL